MEYFVNNYMHNIMQFEEQSPGPRTLSYFNVSSPDSIVGLFDKTSYDEGCLYYSNVYACFYRVYF